MSDLYGCGYKYKNGSIMEIGEDDFEALDDYFYYGGTIVYEDEDEGNCSICKRFSSEGLEHCQFCDNVYCVCCGIRGENCCENCTEKYLKELDSIFWR